MTALPSVLSPYTAPLELPQGVVLLGSGRNPVQVLNKDTLVAQTRPDDPFFTFNSAHLAASAADGSNCVIAQNPGHSYIDIIHWIRGAINSTADLKVRVFGAKTDVRRNNTNGYYPCDYNVNFSHPLRGQIINRLWVPLYTIYTNLHLAVFSGTPEITKQDALAEDPAFKLHSNNITYACKGFDFVAATIDTAATVATGGMLVGSFNS